jgi:hypothetical protein
VDTFEGYSDKMEATNLQTNPEATEPLWSSRNCGCLLVRRRQWAKKWAQESVGFRQKLSAARKRLILRVVPAIRKGNIQESPDRDRVGRGNPKVRTFVKKQRTSSEYNNGINGRRTREETRQRMWRTSDRTARKTIRLEIGRRIVRSAVGRRRMNNRAF